MSDDTKRKGWYSFERLEVYHLAMRFRVIVKQIIEITPAGFEDDIKQLDRSSKSSVRNICEGAGEYRPREKARFYRMSLRSAEESGGSLRLLEMDTRRHPLFEEAHQVNYELIGKLTALCINKSKSRP